MPHKTRTKKQSIALNLIANGLSPTEAMRQAGYAKSSTRIPKQALLKSAGVQNIIKVMQGVLLDEGITGIFLAETLAEFARDGRDKKNIKTFTMAYDRISKIVGIEPNQKEITPARQVTFTEWVTDPTQEKKEIVYKDENQDDLIALDSIKLDRLDNPIVNSEEPYQNNEDKELIY